MSGEEPSLLWRTGLPNVALIARREVMAYAVSPSTWVVGVLFLLTVSVFYLQGVIWPGRADMDEIFSVVLFLMLFGVPLYTKRLLAQERRSGTLDLLLASPARTWEVVVGKWLGGCAIYLVAVAFTLVYVALISYYRFQTASQTVGVGPIRVAIPDLDYGLVLGGYAGLVLAGGMMVAVGLCASGLTSDQLRAALGSIGVLLLLWYVGEVSFRLPMPLGSLLNEISGANRYAAFPRGLLTLRDVIYFLTVTAACLFLTTRLVASRRWK